MDRDTLSEKTALDYGSEVSAVAYSPCGGFLAVAGANRHVLVYETSTYQVSPPICQVSLMCMANQMRCSFFFNRITFVVKRFKLNGVGLTMQKRWFPKIVNSW